MKFTTSVLSGLALCVANVAAQDFGSLPSCARSCATNAIPASCGLDVKCICSTSSFISSVSCCVATACDAADQQTTLQFAEQLCAGAGITNLPSAAGCSATGAATGTATGAATSAATAGTATSIASAASSAVTSAKTSASAVSSSAAATTTASGTASSSASSSSHSGAATPLAKGNGVAAAGAGAAALLAAIFV
ncbi:CFEM domain protein [Talaromyces pinophilus]|uniref:CFEM domain protein n=1 Tax=Talaromyces pinophilus TaxID=128442 RepID=A0A6N4SL29_TALPI|nr:CFEM domain protein [Talaromyces pinophilus]